MSQDDKERQRYKVKWVLVLLVSLIIISGLIGYFKGIKDHTIILVMLGEVITLLGVFFGFNMKTSVSKDGALKAEAK